MLVLVYHIIHDNKIKRGENPYMPINGHRRINMCITEKISKSTNMECGSNPKKTEIRTM